MLELFDTHTHLDAIDFDGDREEVISRAKNAGVSRLVTIGAGYGMTSMQRAVQIAEQHSGIWASAGVHPHDAGKPGDAEALHALARHKKVVAIGETGLDFYRDWAAREDQERWFRVQIEIAKDVKKPLIIHSREAGLDCWRILKEMNAGEVGGVFHCYAEDSDFAQKLQEMNFMISVPGSVTFKNAGKLRDTLAQIPLAQIMIETDAPYLAPAPYRGKRCESSYVLETARALAAVKGVSLEELAAATTENALRFFKLGKEEA